MKNSIYSQEHLGRIQIHSKPKLINLIQSYYFYQFLNKFDIYQVKILFQNIANSEIVIINKCKTKDDNIFLIISFQNTIIIIKKSLLYLLAPLFNIKTDLKFYFLQNTRSIFDQQMQDVNCDIKTLIECDESIDEEIENFNKHIYTFKITEFEYPEMYTNIKISIARYLIQESYNKLNKEQAIDFSKDFVLKTNQKKEMIIQKWDDDEYIDLKILGSGSASTVKLVYQIEDKKLYAIKMQYATHSNNEDYLTREYKNYFNIQYPLLPKLYGIYKLFYSYYLKIQFINGKTLNNFTEQELSSENKFSIILQLMLIIKYLHDNGFVYRDLKPNNVIVDDNNTVFVIDFDRMVPEIANKVEIYTSDFSEYTAPEINYGQIKTKGDIYSLGKIIYYILNKKDLNKAKTETEFDESNSLILDYSKSFVSEDPNNRPPIFDILFVINSIFPTLINGLPIRLTPEFQFFQNIINVKHSLPSFQDYFSLSSAKSNIIEAQYNLGLIYEEGKYIKQNVNKFIYYCKLTASQNHSSAQFNLGVIYEEGEYVKRDINKSIQYFTLAANQNDLRAQFNLGLIYYEGKYIKRDISKSIHYFTLAANQNNPQAQYNLGLIYKNGEYITQNINKAIYYYTLAANQNYVEAQYNLGLIYEKGEYIAQDINKAIYYYTLAANQNYVEAQYNLGLIYEKGEYIAQDINKAIYYYTLAANQNNPYAQLNLGFIYGEELYTIRDIKKSIYYYTLAANQNIIEAQYNLGQIYEESEFTRDINKSIYYYTLAAKQNYINAQFNLGMIYLEGRYVTRDINRSIYYFELAANQNDVRAQYNLGLIYDKGEYIKKDINKSIYYFTLAANQNDSQAQFNLGLIYYEGKDIKRDINKSIYYYTLAANRNIPQAQLNLGLIYEEGEYVKRDTDKSIYYFTLAANQNYPNAQYVLGMIYLNEKNVNIGINLLIKASSAGDITANFVVGYLYHEGKYVDRNINKCIKHYKYASSFNNIYSKNNLGVIYRNGIGNEISKNIGYAIEYFNESIQRWEDNLSMYNLAHIYIYEYKTNEKINESIELLIRSLNKNFGDSLYLLCIALIKKHEFDIEKMRKELIERSCNFTTTILQFIFDLNLLEKSIFQQFEKEFETIDFLYDFTYSPVLSKCIIKQKNERNNIKLKTINQYFYDGFGYDILSNCNK